jgi:hypothetical protein
MKSIVAEPLRGEPVQARRLHRTAKRAGRAEARIIEQDEDDVGRARPRLDQRGPIRNGVPRPECDLALEGRLGPWQHVLSERRLSQRHGAQARELRQRAQAGSPAPGLNFIKLT